MQADNSPTTCRDCVIEGCWIVNDEGMARRCVLFLEKLAKRKIGDMVGAASNYDVKIPSFSDLEYDINDIRSIVEAVKSFPDSQGNFLFLSSPNGTGKTHLMLSLLYQVLAAGETAYYIRAIALKELWVKQARGGLSQEDSAELYGFISSQWKFIDELGGEGNPNHFEGKLTELLDRRYDRFVMASNLDPERGVTKFSYTDNRLLSRLSGATVLRWPGESYRKIKKNGGLK